MRQAWQYWNEWEKAVTNPQAARKQEASDKSRDDDGFSIGNPFEGTKVETSDCYRHLVRPIIAHEAASKNRLRSSHILPEMPQQEDRNTEEDAVDDEHSQGFRL